MHYYSRHLFVCANERADGEACCRDFDAAGAREYLRERLRVLRLDDGPGQVRVSRSG